MIMRVREIPLSSHPKYQEDLTYYTLHTQSLQTVVCSNGGNTKRLNFECQAKP